MQISLLKALSVVAVILLIAPHRTFAKDNAPFETSPSSAASWFEVLNQAEQFNPQIIAAREGLLAAQHRHRATLGAFLPQLSLDLGYSRGDRGGQGPSLASIPDTTGVFRTSRIRESYSGGLSLSQSIFRGFGDQARRAEALADIAIAQAELDEVLVSVGQALRQSFTDVLFNRELVTLSSAIAQRRRDNVELVQLRYESGREHQGSLLRSQAQRSDAEFQVSEAQRNFRTTQQSLATLIAEPQTNLLNLFGTLNVPTIVAHGELEHLARLTPEYALAESRLLRSQASLVVAESQRYPTLSAVASLDREDDSFFPQDDSWLAGISLQLPLFTGGTTTSLIRAAEAELRRNRSLRSAALLNRLTALREAYASLESAVERVGVQDQFVAAAVLRADIARSQYTSGLLSYEDWDLIENDLINAERNALQSRRDAMLADAQWARARGTVITVP